MRKIDVSKIVSTVKTAAVKHSPDILTGIGIAGMLTTIVMAVKATPKAMALIGEAEEEKSDFLTKTETVKVAWKTYIPAAITATVSTACLIGASSVNARRNAVLATAYSLSESALTEYKEKVLETVGEKKEKEISDKVAKECLVKNPIGSNEVIITEKGDTLCYDGASGRYFKSDIDKIKRAEHELNRRLLSEMYISLNDFYYELGLRPTKLGDELGWNLDDGSIDLDFSSQLAEDGTPCLVVRYDISPRLNYRSLM